MGEGLGVRTAVTVQVQPGGDKGVEELGRGAGWQAWAVGWWLGNGGAQVMGPGGDTPRRGAGSLPRSLLKDAAEFHCCH